MTDVLAGFLGAALVYAATAKLGALDAFSSSLLWLAPRPRSARILAWAVIVLEAILGIGVLIPVLRAEMATAAMALMTVFTATLAYARVRGLQGSCLCFGGESEPISAGVIARDIAMALLFWLVTFSGGHGSLYLEWAGVGVFLLVLILTGLHTSLGWIRRPA